MASTSLGKYANLYERGVESVTLQRAAAARLLVGDVFMSGTCCWWAFESSERADLIGGKTDPVCAFPVLFQVTVETFTLLCEVVYHSMKARWRTHLDSDAT